MSIVSKSPEECWKSRPGVKENVYEVIFDEISTTSVVIKWVKDLHPTQFHVYVLQDFLWELIYSITTEESEGDDSDKSTLKIKMNAQSYRGFRVVMEDGKGEESDGQDKKICYGINKLEITTDIY